MYEDGKVKEVPIKLLVEKRNMVRKAKAMTNEDSKKSFLTRQESSFSNIFNFKSMLRFSVCSKSFTLKFLHGLIVKKSKISQLAKTSL